MPSGPDEGLCSDETDDRNASASDDLADVEGGGGGGGGGGMAARRLLRERLELVLGLRLKGARAAHASIV
jgi:hypothetical protein